MAAQLPSPATHVRVTAQSPIQGPLAPLYIGEMLNSHEPVFVKIIDVIDETYQWIPFLLQRKKTPLNNACKIIDVYMDHSTNTGYLWIVFEHCALSCIGELAKELQSKYDHDPNYPLAFNEGSIAFVAQQVLVYLSALASAGKSHGFISSSSIFVKDSMEIRVIDPLVFKACRIDQSLQYQYNSPEFLSGNIELNNNSKQLSKCDVWSLGIVIIEIANAINPFIAFDKTQVLEALTRGDAPLLSMERRWSAYIIDFVACCLKKQVQSRADVNWLLAHAFMKLSSAGAMSLYEQIKYCRENDPSRVELFAPSIKVIRPTSSLITAPVSSSKPVSHAPNPATTITSTSNTTSTSMSSTFYAPAAPPTISEPVNDDNDVNVDDYGNQINNKVTEPAPSPKARKRTESLRKQIRRATNINIPDNLVSLAVLDEDSIVDALNIRYDNDLIYTWVGDMLVAINPFKQLQIYMEDTASRYRMNVERCFVPHIYSLAESAFKGLIHNKRNQCCLISGESGAGKSESAKYFTSHLLSMDPSNTRRLEENIAKMNPLLEAFGNARTIFNDNSSRFGKYMEIHYDEHCKVIGATIHNYLLEKFRVVFKLLEKQISIFFHIYFTV